MSAISKRRHSADNTAVDFAKKFACFFWCGERAVHVEMDARTGDARQFMSDRRKLMDTVARLLTNGWISIGT